MTDLPRREQTEEEKKIVAAMAKSEKDKQEQKERIERNEKIRCPCCKKNMYFDQFLSNKQMGCLLCPKCGVLFIDAAKLKIIKKNISEAKQAGRVNIIKPAAPDSPISILSQNQQRRR